MEHAIRGDIQVTKLVVAVFVIMATMQAAIDLSGVAKVWIDHEVTNQGAR